MDVLKMCVASYTLVRSDCVAAHREFIPAAISRHCALMIAVKNVINAFHCTSKRARLRISAEQDRYFAEAPGPRIGTCSWVWRENNDAD